MTSPGSKYGENKLINDLETSVAPLTQTVSRGPPRRRRQLGRHHASPGSTRRRHPVLLPAPGRRHVHGHGQHRTGPQPEQAGQLHLRRRDPALTYTGNWTHAGPSNQSYTTGDYDTTESWSQQAGASMSVTFTGTAVQWIGAKNTNGGIADVYRRRHQVATVDTYTRRQASSSRCCSATAACAAARHTLQIVVTGPAEPGLVRRTRWSSTPSTCPPRARSPTTSRPSRSVRHLDQPRRPRRPAAHRELRASAAASTWCTRPPS